MHRVRTSAVVLAALTATAAAGVAGVPAAASGPRVLRVGTWHGVAGQYRSIQAAVLAAHPGDWVLVGPGDYKEQGYPGEPEPAGVLVTTPSVHLRGMDRNAVIVDGTKPGTPVCSPRASDQQVTSRGRDGVEEFKVSGVTFENFTVCNYLTNAAGKEGNEIWWNGGDGSGRIGTHAYSGQYLTGTTTYTSNGPQGEYGIFVSNSDGPGLITHTYASNMADSDYYIGACPDCNTVLDDAHAEDSALGFSGTNAGGHLVIQNSEFDLNRAGIVPNTLNNDDWPSPQNGACPGDGTGPTGTRSCTVLRNNYVHDNNNPDTPGSGVAAAGTPGTGIDLSGDQNDTVVGNRVVRNGAFGIVINDYPDTENPPADVVAAGDACRGGLTLPGQGGTVCYYQSFGNEVAHNYLAGNGFFGNPGEGDLALATSPHNPGNCFHDNADPAGVSSDPPAIQSLYGTCGQPNGWLGAATADLVCGAAGFLSSGAPLPPGTAPLVACPTVPPVLYFPPSTGVKLMAIPHEPTMPDPCAGVPVNPWCPAATAPAPAAPSSLRRVPARSATGALAATGGAPLLAAVAVGLVAAGLLLQGRRRRA